MQKYGLVHTDFPVMLWELEKNSLNYYIREYPLYAAELKFAEDSRYLCYLIVRMFSQNPVWAEALLKKYDLYNNKVFEMEGCDQKAKLAEERKRFSQPIKNVLIEKDTFGATELRVLGEPEDYI